jgi:hypothetical protein
MIRREFLKIVSVIPLLGLIKSDKKPKQEITLLPTQEEVMELANSRLRPFPTRTNLFFSSPTGDSDWVWRLYNNKTYVWRAKT